MSIGNISELDLNDPANIRSCLNVWEYIEELAPDYSKVDDLKLEIEEREKRANLTPAHAEAIRLNLKEGYTQKETGAKMNTGTRWIKRLVDEAVDQMAEVDV